jgi:hypothetical protein
VNDPGWEKITDAIDAKFGVTDHGRRTEPLEDNAELTQTVTHIVFSAGGEQYKMERVARPAVIDRKTHYHRAAGSLVRYENIYDPDSLTFKTLLYRRVGGDWVEIDPSQLAL